MSLSFRVFLVILATIVAVAAGWWLGGVTAPWVTRVDRTVAAPTVETASVVTPASSTPVMLALPMGVGIDREIALKQLALAAAAGVHLYLVQVPLPWPDHGPDINYLRDVLQDLVDTDPKCGIFLSVKLDPPDSWLAAHPDAAAVLGGQTRPSVSLASPVWRDVARAALTGLIEFAQGSSNNTHILGYHISCLEDGRWERANGFDASEANTLAFRAWLANVYREDAALQAAWGDPSVTLRAAAVPARPKTDDSTTVFVTLPGQQNLLDYLRYSSESTAEVIGMFGKHIKNHAGEGLQVFASYGTGFDSLNNDSGQQGLSVLLASAVDALVTPVSYVDRGVGGAGGFMGAVDAARLRGKRWYLLDDTRTGITRDPATGTISRVAGLQPEDVYHVQQRNFAAALTHQLGLIWTDPKGEGQLLDEDMWKRFQGMREAYDAVLASPTAGSSPYDLRPDARPQIIVAMDERSRAYQLCDTSLNALLLQQTRDAVIRSGATAQFCLLKDVFDGVTPPANVYIFPNAFYLTPEERQQLQTLLEQNKATAIWLFAPGFFSGAGPGTAENIAATVQLPVKAFSGAEKSGSEALLDGRWLTASQEIGPTREWAPLFYLEGENIFGLAKYRDSGKTSAAITFFPTGWASAYVCEPALTVSLLREILGIVEQHLVFRRSGAMNDAVYFGPNLVAVHAGERGERVIDLGAPFTVQDLLDPERGWADKQFINLDMAAGETRILRLTPSVSQERP